MSKKTIKELFLFPNYKIIVFNGNSRYYTVKGSHVCYGNYESKTADAVENDFMNRRIDVSNCKMLGKVSELTDEKCAKVFKEARYLKNEFPNFKDVDGKKLSSPLESIKSYLIAEKWEFDLDKTWIIIPKPSKKLTGTKTEIEFDISDEKFKGWIKTNLDVYFTPIKSNTKEINYMVEVPDYLYDFLMLHPEIDKRPKSKTFTSNVFSQLLTHIKDLSMEANNLTSADEEMKKAEKVILIYFGSSQKDVRDSWCFGYAGKETKIAYQYYVGYKVNGGFLSNRRPICVSKRYEQGKGFVEIPITERKVYIGSENYEKFKVIEWTQEREDFLNMIEVNFKKLSDNLNNYLSDLDGNKLDLLISNKTNLLN